LLEYRSVDYPGEAAIAMPAPERASFLHGIEDRLFFLNKEMS
jgi:hypothetical protein